MYMLWTCARSGSTAGIWGMVGWQMARSDQRNQLYYNSSQTRIELQAAARGLDCWWAAGS